MSAHGNDAGVRAGAELAQRDALLADMTRSKQQLQHLYDIGRLLLRFRSIEETVPAVIAIVARSLPLRSAIFVLTMGPPCTLEFQAEGGHPRELREARAHAAQSFGALVPAQSVPAFAVPAVTRLPPLPLPLSRMGAAQRRFVLCPLIVNRGAIFGALQLECATALDDVELTFVNAVVDQLATAVERDAVDQALRTSEAKLAGIMSMAADAIITVDEQMQIVMYNEGAERIFGWTLAEVTGKPVEMLLPSRFADAHRGHVRAFHGSTDTARKMGARLPEIFGRRKDGAEFPAQAAISKLNVDGAWLFTVILRDITEQRRVESDKAFLAEVSAALGQTLDNERTLSNVARFAMHGVADFCVIEFMDERGELRRLEVVSEDPDKADLALALKRYALDRDQPHLSSSILRENKPQIISHVTGDFLRSIAQDEQHLALFEAMGLQSIMGVPLVVGGRAQGSLIVGSCVLGRRYGPSELELLVEVGLRAALALESARLYRVAQRAVAVRDDVLGVVAHDLRNPLNSIMLQATLFRRRGVEPERRQRNPGEVIERAAQRMNRLIQDLLDVTSIEAGHLSIERACFPVRQIIRDLLESQQPMASAQALDLRLDDTETCLEVWADRERLFQMLENLVGNAAKFTARGGHINVGARAQGGGVLLWVADTGTGIAAADLPLLFDRFWQVRKAERRGAGLGLAIVKGLVESHAGRIWVESVLGSGTTFFFTLPAQAA
jgi:PAS domain S-box-containing protein